MVKNYHNLIQKIGVKKHKVDWISTVGGPIEILANFHLLGNFSKRQLMNMSSNIYTYIYLCFFYMILHIL